jgi:diacylglycerol O-acyltransferase / wax synthase
LVPPPDRLSALDATFLDLETPEAPLHVGWTMRFDGPPPSLAALRRHVDARLALVPRFRRRVVRPAFGLGDAYWADDPAFDIANHVHGLRLADPGGPQELRELAGALLSVRLDHRRPLWRLCLIDGLASGGFALVGQAHHALVDGIAAIQVALLLFDSDPLGAQGASVPAAWTPKLEPPPHAVALASATARVRTAMRGSGSVLRALGQTSPGTLWESRGAWQAIAAAAPKTALDRTESRRRVVGFADVSLPDVRDAGRRHGATINDVVLAGTTIALGRALRRCGDRLERVKAMVPVNVRGDEPAAELGNRISAMHVDLPVAETDPLRVLRLVRSQTRARKSGGGTEIVQGLGEAADLLPGVGRRTIVRAASRAAPYNVIVSNVPGPPVQLYILGRPLTALYPAVPIEHDHGPTIGALSYRDRLHVGVYADAAVLPDVVDLARDLEAAFDVLRALPAPEPTPWRARARALRDQRAPASRYTGPFSEVT